MMPDENTKMWKYHHGQYLIRLTFKKYTETFLVIF